jgi:hypothetical protein
MKWVVRIVFILSLILNGYLIADEVWAYRIQEIGKELNSISLSPNKKSWKEGAEIVAGKLKEKNSSLLNKK